MKQKEKKGQRKLRSRAIETVSITVDFVKKMFRHMTNAIAKKIDEINKRNYFPVPDKDTGANLASTIGRATKAIDSKDYPSRRKLIEDLTEEILLNSARGNIGLIISAWLSAFLNYLKNRSVLDAKTLARAFAVSALAAHQALDNPCQGTVLDPISGSSQAAVLACTQGVKDLVELMERVQSRTREAVEETTDKLKDLLAENFTPEEIQQLQAEGVVDAGALGFLVIISGLTALLQEMAEEEEKETTTVRR